MKSVLRIILVFVFGLTGSYAPAAQWQVVDLYPSGVTGDSQVVGVFGNEQAGFILDSGGTIAAVWHGTAASFVNNGNGFMTATDGTQQVGWSQQSGGGVFAARWVNGVVSFLGKPSGANGSGVYAIAGRSYVGFYTLPGSPGQRAFYWIKTNKGVSLHPAGYASSLADAASGNLQAGNICPVTQTECFAAVWRGRASTVANVHPGGYQTSNIRGMQGNIGVGWATLFSGQLHAGFWDVQTGAFTDLHPPGFAAPGLNAISNNWAAGTIWPVTPDEPHAAVFDLTNSSNNVDLHVFLPPGQYTNSAAFTIYRNEGGDTYVGGMATSATDLAQHAMIWILP